MLSIFISLTCARHAHSSWHEVSPWVWSWIRLTEISKGFRKFPPWKSTRTPRGVGLREAPLIPHRSVVLSHSAPPSSRFIACCECRMIAKFSFVAEEELSSIFRQYSIPLMVATFNWRLELAVSDLLAFDPLKFIVSCSRRTRRGSFCG